MGVLAAIGLPFWLSQTNKAKTAEAYSILRAANQAQLLYFLQHETFAADPNQLQAGIVLESPNYSYTIQGNPFAGDTEAKPKGLLVTGYRGCIYANPMLDKPAIAVGSLGQSPPPCQ